MGTIDPIIIDLTEQAKHLHEMVFPICVQHGITMEAPRFRGAIRYLLEKALAIYVPPKMKGRDIDELIGWVEEHARVFTVSAINDGEYDEAIDSSECTPETELFIEIQDVMENAEFLTTKCIQEVNVAVMKRLVELGFYTTEDKDLLISLQILSPPEDGSYLFKIQPVVIES